MFEMLFLGKFLFFTGQNLTFRFGLSQANLARIWAHVDVQKTGRLDLEQYAKCILLIRECQEGLTSKISMSIASPAPPMALTRRDSQISTNSVCHKHSSEFSRI